MANKKRTKGIQPDEVPTLEIPISEIGGTRNRLVAGEKETRYVVIRGGLRVSDKDYPEQNEPESYC